ncbi:MAG: fluoride efflux transporter FluC [Acidimicrobiia bacterium]
MDTMIGVLMAVAGGLGALARFEMASRVGRDGRFPFGTLLVNTSGALLTGFAAAANLPPEVHRVLVTGFLGGFTTFSTWMVETGLLARDEPTWKPAALNLGGMLAAGLVGVVLGATLA